MLIEPDLTPVSNGWGQVFVMVCDQLCKLINLRTSKEMLIGAHDLRGFSPSLLCACVRAIRDGRSAGQQRNKEREDLFSPFPLQEYDPHDLTCFHKSSPPSHPPAPSLKNKHCFRQFLRQTSGVSWPIPISHWVHIRPTYNNLISSYRNSDA